MNILAIANHGFEDVELIATTAILRRSGLQVDIASIQESQTITGAYQTTIQRTCHLSEVDFMKYDALLLPGGPHTQTLRENQEVLALTKAFDQHHKYLFAICAAPSILGVLGILAGKQYTCFPGFESFVEGGIKRFAKVVQDGRIITAAGAGASLEFAFQIIELLQGKEQRDFIESKIQYRVET